MKSSSDVLKSSSDDSDWEWIKAKYQNNVFWESNLAYVFFEGASLKLAMSFWERNVENVSLIIHFREELFKNVLLEGAILEIFFEGAILREEFLRIYF